jgi:TIGR00252 family protein
VVNKKNIGNYGEDYACEYIRSIGYKIIKRNYFSRNGEIDIIALKDNILVFIEVKTRCFSNYGLGEESISYTKKVKCIKTAKYFIHKNNLYHLNVRFDVITITLDIDKNKKSIQYYEDAFSV